MTINGEQCVSVPRVMEIQFRFHFMRGLVDFSSMFAVRVQRVRDYSQISWARGDNHNNEFHLHLATPLSKKSWLFELNFIVARSVFEWKQVVPKEDDMNKPSFVPKQETNGVFSGAAFI